MDTRKIGSLAEGIAARFLRLKGYEILAANYRFLRKEIDLVVGMGERIVFVEVKFRRTMACGQPREAVDARKRRRILTAAQGYLAEARLESRPCRFDVVEVSLRRGGLVLEVTHIPGAFSAR